MTANVESRFEAGDAGWLGALLVGVVFILAGAFVLGDVVLASVISAFLIGLALVVAGAVEVFQAFSAQHWRGFTARILVGLLYALCGLMLVADPARGSIILTLVLAFGLIASGFVRIHQAVQLWHRHGSLLLLSGIAAVVAGFVVLARWPTSGLWVLGLLVGIDLLVHGFWWFAFGSRLRQEQSVSSS
jgi:uncharacterized membrane protein HdeD (DUF308 family)